MTSKLLTAEQLQSGLEQLEIRNAVELTERLIAFGKLLIEENRSTNLVGAKTLGELIAPHFLDSLAPLVGSRIASPIADIGSGGGLPGIPVALAFPNHRVVLFEPRAKRAAFLRRAAELLEIPNVEIYKTTAETASRTAWFAKAGTVLLRAVASPKAALELGMPLVRRGGFLVLYIGKQSTPDKGELSVAKGLGGSLLEASPVIVPYLDAVRHAWWFQKTTLVELRAAAARAKTVVKA